jgi:hypothetical protein
MKTEMKYRYTLLRYEHDIRTEEFLNLGLLFWVPDQKTLKFRYTENKSRLSATFPDSSPSEIFECLKELADRFERLERQESAPSGDLLEIAYSVLPRDDSSLRWACPSAGVTDSAESALEEIYHGLVTRYEHRKTRIARTNHDVWNDLELRLKPHNVLHLISKTIVRSPMRKYEFDHSWRNHQRHIIAPVSLDAEKAEGIADKATEWMGRILDLNRSEDEFSLALVLGTPQKKEFFSEYESAVDLLRNETKSDRMKVVPADDVESFASKTLADMKAVLWRK